MTGICGKTYKNKKKKITKYVVLAELVKKNKPNPGKVV